MKSFRVSTPLVAGGSLQPTVNFLRSSRIVESHPVVRVEPVVQSVVQPVQTVLVHEPLEIKEEVVNRDSAVSEMVVKELVKEINLWKSECMRLREQLRSIHELELMIAERDKKMITLKNDITGMNRAQLRHI